MDEKSEKEERSKRSSPPYNDTTTHENSSSIGGMPTQSMLAENNNTVAEENTDDTSYLLISGNGEKDSSYATLSLESEVEDKSLQEKLQKLPKENIDSSHESEDSPKVCTEFFKTVSRRGKLLNKHHV